MASLVGHMIKKLSIYEENNRVLQLFDDNKDTNSDAQE